MKLEIEITEEEIRSAIERKVRTAVADQTNKWGIDVYIQDQVKRHWVLAVDALVEEMLGNSQVLQEKIDKEVDRRIRAKITRLMK